MIDSLANAVDQAISSLLRLLHLDQWVGHLYTYIPNNLNIHTGIQFFLHFSAKGIVFCINSSFDVYLYREQET